MSFDLSMRESIHSRALEASSRYLAAEAELVELLQQVEEHRVYVARGHASLFAYVVTELGLSESVAYNLIAIARKARQVPELKAQLQAGAITLSNARKIAPVLVPGAHESNAEWLQKASTLSNRQLEREVVKVRPEEATRERASYVAPDRVKLVLGLSERQMLRLRRVQDLMCQAQRRAVILEEVIGRMSGEYLRRHDPVEKAKRHQVKKGPIIQSDQSDTTGQASETGKATITLKTPVTPKAPATNPGPVSDPRSGINLRQGFQRTPIPADVLHQVNLRDGRRCTHILPDGTRCNQSQWVEIHHQQPVSQGGENTLENLVTLCSPHHQYWHMKRRP